MAVSCAIWLLTLGLCAVTSSALSYDLNAQKGRHFHSVISKKDFFKGENNVQFTVSLFGKPDLPTWLKFEQHDPMSDAILYGTPDEDAGSVELGIIGWNKETYETMKKPVYLTVSPKDPKSQHPIELRVKNKDLMDLMKNGRHFLETVNQIWPGTQYITSLDRPNQRFGVNHRFSREDGKESVFIGVTGNSTIPEDFNLLKSKCRSVPLDSVIQKAFIDSGYSIDWCSFRNLKINSESFSPKFKFDDSSMFYDGDLKTTKYDLKRADLTLDIIYVFIAVLIGLVLIIFLTCLMCFNREGLRHRNNLTPKEQLLHHKALRRVGAQLRNMSGQDELNNSFPYGKLDEDSKTGTLSSNKPPTELESSPSPPPYRHGSGMVKRQDSKF